MANLRMTLLDLLNKSEQGAHPNFLRDGVRLLAQELMEAEVTELVGAGPHERSETRLTHRNGYREREWDTRVGTIELDIPKLRAGSYFPSLLEPRRRHERALLSVVQEAYVHGVSTRAVDNLAEALGIKSISKDQVSRICKELDAQVHAFRTRRLDGEFPYLFLDATFEKVRENGRVISMAVLIAVGVRSTGEREVVGVDVGPAEDHEFWLQFLRQLASRGLSGVRLVISDSHLGLKQAVAQVFVGATWQRGPVAELTRLSENWADLPVAVHVLVGGVAHDGAQSHRAEAVLQLLARSESSAQPPCSAACRRRRLRVRSGLGQAALQPHRTAFGRPRRVVQAMAARIPVQHHERASTLRRSGPQPGLALVSRLRAG
jgi:putative transposase